MHTPKISSTHTKILHHIIIMGPQHVGKSTIATMLSKTLAMPFVDSDALILSLQSNKDFLHTASKERMSVQTQGHATVRALYAAVGKKHFLQLEALAIEHALLQLSEYHICATGGGLADNAVALSLIKSCPHKILLSTDATEVWTRIIANGMPAYLSNTPLASMTAEEIENARLRFVDIFTRRLQIYNDHADFVINVKEKSPEKIVGEIIHKLSECL